MRNLCSSGAASSKSASMVSIWQVSKRCGKIALATANFARLLVMMISVSLACSPSFSNGLKEPDAKRKAEIVAALSSHGFKAGNWQEAKTVMKGIAAEHGWQTNRVPDARVLILLDLGNVHSNPWVATQQGGRLDPPYGEPHDEQN